MNKFLHYVWEYTYLTLKNRVHVSQVMSTHHEKVTQRNIDRKLKIPNESVKTLYGDLYMQLQFVCESPKQLGSVKLF